MSKIISSAFGILDFLILDTGRHSTTPALRRRDSIHLA